MAANNNNNKKKCEHVKLNAPQIDTMKQWHPKCEWCSRHTATDNVLAFSQNPFVLWCLRLLPLLPTNLRTSKPISSSWQADGEPTAVGFPVASIQLAPLHFRHILKNGPFHSASILLSMYSFAFSLFLSLFPIPMAIQKSRVTTYNTTNLNVH